MTTNRSFHFDVAPAVFWSAISAVDRYQSWWPWLRRFDAEPLSAGARWACEVQPPLPYRVRFDVDLVEVHEPEWIRVEIRGDIVGSAGLEVADAGSGCDVHLRSSLSPRNPFLGLIGGLAPRLVRFGHDWVMETGARQFTREAI